MPTLRELVTLVGFKVVGKEAAEAAASAIKAGLQKSADAANTLGAQARKAGKEVKHVGDAAKHAEERLTEFGHAMRHAAVALGLLYGGHQLMEMADEWAQISASIRNTTTSAQEFAAVRNSLFEMSQRTGLDMEGPSALFNQLSMDRKETGLSNPQILKLTDIISKGLALNHGSAAQNQRAIRQFDEMLSQGKISQVHLNSLQQDAPVLAGYLAQAAGGKEVLRAMSEAGRGGKGKPGHQMQEIIDLVQKMGPIVDKAFGNVQLTFGMAAAHIRNDMMRLLGEFLVDNHTISTGLHAITATVTWLREEIEKGADAVGGFSEGLKLVAILGVAAFGPQIGALVVSLTEKVWGLVAGEGAMLLPWLMTTAAIAAALLAMEDIYSWVEGKKSVTGYLIGPYANFKKEIEGIGTAIKDAFGFEDIRQGVGGMMADLHELRVQLFGLRQDEKTPSKWGFAADVHEALADLREIIDLIKVAKSYTDMPIDWLMKQATKLHQDNNPAPAPPQSDAPKPVPSWMNLTDAQRKAKNDAQFGAGNYEDATHFYDTPTAHVLQGSQTQTITNAPIVNNVITVHAPAGSAPAIGQAAQRGAQRAMDNTDWRKVSADRGQTGLKTAFTTGEVTGR